MENPQKHKQNTDSIPSAYESNKLTIAAGLNLIGDVILFLEGIGISFAKDKDGNKPQKNLFNAAAGGLYSLGALTAAVFGRISPKERFHDLKYQVAEFIDGRLDRSASQTQSARIVNEKSQNFWNRAERYLRRYAGQVMLWFYTLGAAVMFAGGIKQQHEKKDKGVDGDLLVGGFSLLVKLTSAIMPEARESEQSDTGAPKGFWSKLKSQPMKIFGYGSFLTEIFWGYSAWKKKENGQEWRLRAATTASYAASDLVIATANKDAVNRLGDLHDREVNELEEMVAETIAHQSEGRQAQLTEESAEFIAQQSGIARSKEALTASIKARVEQYKKPSNWQESTQTGEMAELAL